MDDMHLYNQYLLNINYLPDIILGTDDTALNKNKALCSQNLESKYTLLVTSYRVDGSANIWASQFLDFLSSNDLVSCPSVARSLHLVHYQQLQSPNFKHFIL